MNIFYSCVYSSLSLGIINRLIERYNAENCYIVHAVSDDYKNVKGNVSEYYFHRKVIDADYSGYIFEKDCPALDKKLLKSMSEHEPIIIKMIERFASHISIDYESRVRQYHRHLRYWNHMLDAAKIDMAVFLNVPHEVYDYTLYCLCKKKGIATALTFGGQLLEYSYFFKEVTKFCPEILSHYQKLALQYQNTSIEEIELPPDFQKYFENYVNRNNDRTPPLQILLSKKNYLSRSQKLKRFINKLKWFFEEIFSFFPKLFKKGLCHMLLMAKNYLNRVCFISKNKRLKKRLLKAYNSLSVPADFSKPYIYFPLQMQPECTTSPLGGIYVHQILVAEMLSFYVPDHVQIYIKEHPAQKGHSRNVQLYRDLAALPNVKLVHRSTDTFQLIDNCIAVASLTGTAGFEGLLMGKPFLMFGTQLSMYAPGTFNIRYNEDCKKAIEYILQHGAKHTLKDMKIFLKADSEVSVNCSLREDVTLNISVEENIQRLANGLAHVIDAQLADTNSAIS